MTKNSNPFKIFNKILSFVQEWPRLTLLGFVVLLGVSAYGLKYSKLELDIYDVYDPNFQSSIDLAEIKDFYSDRSQMLVAYQFKSIPKAFELCRIHSWSKDLMQYKEVKNITSLWSLRAPKNDTEKLWYPKTLSDPCTLNPSDEFDIKQEFSHSFFRHLVSATGSKDLVFDITFSGTDSSSSQVQYVMDETDKFVKENFKDVKIRYLGLSASRHYFKKIMLKDSIYNLLVILIIMLLLRFIYGTWLSGFYLVLTLITSCIVLYGTLAWTGIPINILTNNLFLMTAVAGTADFIFVTQYQMKGKYQDSLTDMIIPCFFTTLTTVIGFLSLNTSDLTLIKQFGNGAALGALAEWIMMFMFMPALLKFMGKEIVWVNPEKSISTKWIDAVEKLSMPKGTIFVFAILMILSVPAFFFLNDQDSPVMNLPKSHVLRSGYEDFRKKFLWQGQVHLFFPEKPTPEFHKEIVAKLKTSKLIYRIEDPEELAEEWTRDIPPLRQDLIRRELSGTPLWERYYSSVGQLRIPLYLYDQDLHSLRKLRDEVMKVCKNDCRLAGQRVVYLEYGEKISKTMIESFAVSIFLVIGILGWLLHTQGKLRYFWPVTLSALMGPLVTLTLISFFQIPVTLITSIFLAVMVGLAGDNAIQYLLAPGELSTGIESRARASIIVTIVMMIGSSMFILQTLLPMKILGMLFVFGFFINLVGDFWGLKGLLQKKVD
jgi:predicted RND superfamily exporter protein